MVRSVIGRFATGSGKTRLLRDCICYAILAALAFTLAGTAAEDRPPAIQVLNDARRADSVRQLQHEPRLDELARQYLDAIIEKRDLTPPPAFDPSQRLLAEDIAARMGPDGHAWRHAGLLVAYGLGEGQAVGDALQAEAAWPGMLDRAMELAGLASAVVPPGDPWLVPPVGGEGPAVELTGYTVVVLITAGQSR